MAKILHHLKPYGLSIVAVMALVLLQALSELYLPTLMSDIVDQGIVNGDTGYIIKIGGLMLLVTAAGALCAVGASYLSARAATGFARDLRRRVFTHVESFSLHEFDKLGTSTLITRTTNDISQIERMVMMVLRPLAMAPMMGIGGMVMAIAKNPGLSRVILAIMPVLAAAIAAVAIKGMPLFRAMQVKLDRLNRVLRENLTGIRVIRAFNRAEHEQRRFVEANRDLTETAIRVNQIMATMMPLIMLVMNFSMIAIIWFGGIRIDRGQMQVGDLMAFLQYVTQILFSLVMFSMLFVMIPRAQASAARITEVLETSPRIKDPTEPKEPDGLRGHLEFRSVTFRYPGAEQPALQDLSFCTGPGEVTAIIGGTGSGKSTLVSLIARFYDVDSGAILVDGVDVREMTQHSLRKRLGFVPQTAFLFSGTVAENIRVGKADATEDEIRQAAETAQAYEFIANMDQGYETEIAQAGANLSGGQKQRLAIARALVRRPEIYIFDDTFSALDFKTDARLRAALREETAAATVLIVAQRVSTVMDADRIIVLDEGKVAGMGRHEELMRNCEVYREIVASQLGEDETA